MEFKKWFEDQEWGGASFDGDSDRYVNGPGFPRSKWQGKQAGQGNGPSFLGNVEKMYKLKQPVIVKNMKKTV